MTARFVRMAAIAMLALGSSPTWGQYGPARTGPAQPRSGGQSQVVPVDGRQPRAASTTRNGGKEFRWSDEEEQPGDYRAPARRAGEVVPVAGQTPIRQPGNNQPANRQPANRQPNNVQPANGQAENIQQQVIPCPWDPLPRDQQQALDQLMKDWEQHSSKIERYRCKFERWEYDPVFGPKDPTQAKTYGTGRLLYSEPDKGLFQVESLNVFVPPAKPGEKETWIKRPPGDIGEHWVCDGKQVFEFDARQKKLKVSELPPEMQGKAIVDGPLPFLFGAKSDKINARYWLRLITPQEVAGEQWIEAVPKYAADARNFKMVHVIIDEQDFLPKAIQVFDPAFNPVKHPKRAVYTFNSREYNWNITLQMLNLFHREFYEPSTPLGWTKVLEPFSPEPGQPAAREKTPTARTPNPFKLPFKLR